MKVAVTGATGLLGRRLVESLHGRGDDVLVLSRSSDRASESLGVPAVAWDPMAGPPPESAFEGVSAVVHLAGEPVAQRWSSQVKQRIRDSRAIGTRNLVQGLREAGNRGPDVLISTSASGYYGSRGDEPLEESASAGSDFLAQVCLTWEAEASAATEFDMRVAIIRIGVILDGQGGALAKMLPPFKLGVGGPVAGGKQYVPWIALDDVVGLFLAALDGESWSGPFNAAAPAATTNGELSKALGRALHRPAIMPVPAFALQILYGEMAGIVTGSQRLVPTRAIEHGYRFKFEDLDQALETALS